MKLRGYPLLLVLSVLMAPFLSGCNSPTPPDNASESKEMSDNAVTPEKEDVTSAMTGKPHSGGYNPHGKLTPEKLVTVALQHLQEGRPKEAMYELDRAASQYKDHAEIFAVRGSLLLQNAKISEALADFETALALEPDNAQVLTNRAEAYRQFGRIAEAVNDLNRAIEINPDLVAARFNRGTIHYSSNEFDKALSDFEHCIAVDPHTAAPYFNRASTYDALGKREEAIKDLGRFIELADSDEWKKIAQDLITKWKSDDVSQSSDEEKP